MCIIARQDGQPSALTYITNFISKKHLQNKPITKAIIPSANAEVPMVENVFTFIEYQKLLGYVLSCVNVLFMLKIDICFISGIL